MPSRDEVEQVRKKVESDLLKRPGVTGVDVGYKIVNGQSTDQLAIIVYVENKRDVAAADTIPKEIQGMPTDVVERRYTLH